MSKPIDLKAIFGHFAGREVPMRENKVTLPSGHTLSEVVPVNKNDPVLEEMEKAAQQHGLRLRVWWPGRIGTMDLRSDRVNAEIKKEDDGRWRVSSVFKIG